MSKDVMLFTACNHIINNVHYEANLCPRCRGYSYYYDISFNDGQVVTCEGDIKLQQEVLKIMNDMKNGNKFHTDWGNALINNSVIGSKNIKSIDQKIKIIIFETLQYLKNIQINNQILFKNMSENEIINNIQNITVQSMGISGYRVRVTFENSAGQIFTQEIIV